MAMNLGMGTPQEQAAALYTNNLGRAGDAEGINYWAGQIAAGKDVSGAFHDSAKQVYQDYTSTGKNPYASTLAGDFSSASAMHPDIATPTGRASNDGGNVAATALRLNSPIGRYIYGDGGAKPEFIQNNQGMSAPSLSGYQKSPYLDDMAKGITSQMNDNWTRNLAPSIRSGAMAAGGFGGSRQGVVEANAMNDMNRSLGQNLTNLYGSDYQQSQARNLQKYGMDQGYNLGMANNNLGYASLDSNNKQFGANFGMNAANQQMNWAQGGINAANGIQNTPINYFNTFNGNTNQAGGMGGGTSQTNQGNPFMSAIGGAMAGNALQYPK